MMNFFNRALKNVTRRCSRSILLAVTFFLIGNLVIIGLGINSAAENAKTLTRQKMRAAVAYELDYVKYNEDANAITDEDERNEFYQNSPRITQQSVETIQADSRVKATNYLTTQQLFSSGFDSVPLNNDYDSQWYGDQNSMTNPDGSTYRMADLRVQANLYPDMIEFQDGIYQMVEGRFYNQQEIDDAANVVCIPKELADLNNLRVGDVITVYLNDPAQLLNLENGLTVENYEMSLEIIGIYQNNEQLDPNADEYQWMSRYESPQNTLLMPYTTIADKMYTIYETSYRYNMTTMPEYYSEEDLMSREEYLTPSQVVFLLNDPLEVDQFVEDYSGQLLPYTQLNANNETFKQLARPLDTLSLFSNIIVWIVAVNAVVIITLVTALTLKTREYEIGVLLSIGVTKMKIVAQFFTELIVVALIGFTLSIASGSLIAGRVGEAVLDYQVNTENEYTTLDGSDDNYYSVYDNNYFTEVTQEDLLSEYEVRISPMIIAEIYVLGIGVVFVSIVIPSLMIMRFNPKKILMNQN